MKSLIEVINQVCDRHLAPPEVEAPATAADILRRAAYRVGQPGAWAQHCLGLSADGAASFRLAPDATAHCLLGALYAEHARAPQADIHAAYSAVRRAIGTSLIADWNDHPQRTQDEVVAALVRASEIVEAQ